MSYFGIASFIFAYLFHYINDIYLKNITYFILITTILENRFVKQFILFNYSEISTKYHIRMPFIFVIRRHYKIM